MRRLINSARAVLAAAGLTLLTAPAFGAILDHGFRVEGERMLRPGMWRMSGLYSVESSIRPGLEQISGSQIVFDATRLPLSLRYGFSPKVEFGADMEFEQDDGFTVGPADLFKGSGIAYVDALAKCKIMPWTTMVGRVGLLENNQLYHGGEGIEFGLDVLITLPLNIPIGVPNLMHFNGGIRMKPGDPDIDNDGKKDARGYTNPIHLGWTFIVAPIPKWAVVTELFVRRSPFDLEEEAELSLGARYAATDRTTCVFALTHGISEGAPQWAWRFGFDVMFGSLTERQVMKTDSRRMPKELPGEGTPPLEISVNRLSAIAESSYNRGDYTAAADAYAELVSRIPSDGRIYYNLGVCYYNLRDYARAEGDFLKALSLLPNDAEIHLYLGHCQFMRGRVADARRNWETALRLDPSNELAKFLLSTSK